jgi:hypothetical protein
MVQIDGPRRRVYIKFIDYEVMQTVFQVTNRQREFRHDNGEISQVKVEIAGIGTRRFLIANLPPEIPDCVIRSTVAKYGEVKEISEETWSRVYRYQVSNDIRIAVVALTRHIPTHMTMAGHRALISYEGQPLKCYGCNEIGHQYQACPQRRRANDTTSRAPITSWAAIASRKTASQKPEGRETLLTTRLSPRPAKSVRHNNPVLK